MDLLQSVQAVQRQAQLAVAVFGQGVAALAGLRAVVQLAQGRVAILRVAEDVVVGEEHRLAVVEGAHQRLGRDEEIAQGLQGHIAPAVLQNDVDVVAPQVQRHGVAGAVKGGLVVALEQLRLPRLVEAVLGEDVQQRGLP